jgi:hypothetical protein
MAEVTFSKREARRMLGLAERQDVDDLVERGTLRVGSRSLDGDPRFHAEDLRRAAAELEFLGKQQQERVAPPRTRGWLKRRDRT